MVICSFGSRFYAILCDFYIGLWAVLNNAGVYGRDGPEDWKTMEDHYSVAAVNLFGLINVTKTFMPLLKQSKGRLINTGIFCLGIYTEPMISFYATHFKKCL